MVGCCFEWLLCTWYLELLSFVPPNTELPTQLPVSRTWAKSPCYCTNQCCAWCVCCTHKLGPVCTSLISNKGRATFAQPDLDSRTELWPGSQLGVPRPPENDRSRMTLNLRVLLPWSITTRTYSWTMPRKWQKLALNRASWGLPLAHPSPFLF